MAAEVNSRVLSGMWWLWGNQGFLRVVETLWKKKNYFLVVKLERGSSRVTEQLLNNACVYLQSFDFFSQDCFLGF